ncbi:HD-GYP domain-containing protein [Kineothrix sp. MB12-C1]|uniref:HD-GYP domain-containing protein n=1 Tax=Kineothrix sp. MB12-C1 TaxID=3070215 RepID=UPI0027D2F86D|nr:HD domain-containing phosphohydrolase [Kineothrix sp. MB12-C1]WMC92848.1 HD domain-containing protein [Kineothrix sp. MB12-C1]
MINTACIALKPGMEVGEDVFNYKNELLVPINTILTEEHIKKITRHSVMCVLIKEPVDYATTHFERVRLSQEFQIFEVIYKENLTRYKELMNDFVINGTPLEIRELMDIYNTLVPHAKNDDFLLDYLYHMLPSEDDMTHAHCLNSALIAGVFAKWLNLSNEDTDILIQCGFFYDIGKLKLSSDLLWKPGKLTDLEFAQMKTHTLIGFNLLKELDLNQHILNATLMHHERCDGSGYPSRLRGDKIDRFAKYIAIIDSYEAMTSARMYRQSMHPFQVIERFEKAGFIIYEESILRPILSHIAGTQMGYNVRLSDGRIAEVIVINQKHLSRPLLRAGNSIIDLSSDLSLQIEVIC